MTTLVSLWSALWGVIGVVAVLVLINEAGVDALRAGLRRLRYRSQPRADYRARADAYGGAQWPIGYFDAFWRLVKVDWAPFVQWWQRPVSTEWFTIDGRGLRVTVQPEAANPVRILALGGSTMMGMGARDAATIPSLLAARLSARGHAVHLDNWGQLGHASTQEVITLMQALKGGARPDVVIFYDGVNEMISAEQTGHTDRMFNEAHRRAEFNLLHDSRRRDLIVGGLLALAPRTLRRLRKLTGLRVRGPHPHPQPVRLSGDQEQALARGVIATYAANVETVRLLAARHGFQALFFWQPTLVTKRVKSPHEQRYLSDGTGDLALRERLFAAIGQAWREHPALAGQPDCIDISGIFDHIEAPIYIDPFHLAEDGNAQVAEAMLPALDAAVGRVERRELAQA